MVGGCRPELSPAGKQHHLPGFCKATGHYPYTQPHPFQLKNFQQKIRSGVKEAR